MGVEVRELVVRGPRVATGMRINYWDRVEVVATGTVGFSSFFGLPWLGPDGDNHITPADYPAPRLRKNSLILEVRHRGGYSGNEQWSTFHQGGSRVDLSSERGEIFLLANDASPYDNEGGWRVTLRRHFPDPGAPALAVDAIEIVQTIQRPDNSVVLVSGKPTIVRAYPTGGTGAIERVTGECSVSFGDGTARRCPPLTRGGSSSPITARPGRAHNRGTATASLNFAVGSPPPGPLRVSARLWVEGGAQSAVREAAVTVQPTRQITIQPHLVALPAHQLGPPTEAHALPVLVAALGRWPFGNPGILPIRRVTHTGRLSDFLGWHTLLYAIAAIPNPTASEIIHVLFCLQPTDVGGTTGMALYRPWIPTPACIAAIGTDSEFNVTNCAHEIGHTLGLHHVDDGRTGIPWSAFLPRNTEEPGWRADHGSVVEAGLAEVMGYTDNSRFPSIVAQRFAHFGHHRS